MTASRRSDQTSAAGATRAQSYVVPRIAVIDDDPAIREAVVDLVISAGYEAVPFGSVDEFEEQPARSPGWSLIILDIQMPGRRDGLAFAGTLRATSGIPIIMLTGRGDEIDRVLGLEIGADDYVVKPFNNRELVARIRALLRRSGAVPSMATASAEQVPLRNGYRFGGFVLDSDHRRLETRDGAAVQLTAAEFDLLCVLLAGRGRVLSREQLLTRSRRSEADVFDRTIDVLILRLRRKIEPSHEHPRFIRTERGYGYVFDGAVEVIGQP
ncbi:MAG: DNA-binding response regulator [Chelatococcus sp.]|nr:MAG: DNA-binding response regulator [Chelatococcus sp.]